MRLVTSLASQQGEVWMKQTRPTHPKQWSHAACRRRTWLRRAPAAATCAAGDGQGWVWHRVHAVHGVSWRVAIHLPRVLATTSPGGDALATSKRCTTSHATKTWKDAKLDEAERTSRRNVRGGDDAMDVVGPPVHVHAHVSGIYATTRQTSHVQCRIESTTNEKEDKPREADADEGKEDAYVDVWRMRVDGQHGAARWTVRRRDVEEEKGQLVLDMAVQAPEDARGAKRVLEFDAKQMLQRAVREATEEAEKSAEKSVPKFARKAWKEFDPFHAEPARRCGERGRKDGAATMGKKTRWTTKQEETNPKVHDVQVHLRRLDDATHLHRRAVASVRVLATREQAWNVLQDVQEWCQFVPGLVRSVRVHGQDPTEEGRKNVADGQKHATSRNRRRRYQQTYRTHLVAVPLDAHLQLDVVIKDDVEMQFRIQDMDPEGEAEDPRQVQGKWLIQPCDTMDEQGRPIVLKFAMEARMSRQSTSHRKGQHAWKEEPLDEKVVYEDVPEMLLAFRDRIQGETTTRDATLERPGLTEMKENLDVLAIELKRAFGEDCALPPRAELRKARRTDLEKAIAHHGGALRVAEAIGATLAYSGRKPRGHWDRLETVREEIEGFQWTHGLDPKVMPTRTEFQRKGRKDIARALERWGGGPALAQLLGLETTQTRAKSNWDLHLERVARDTGARGVELFRFASQTYARTPPQAAEAGDILGKEEDGSCSETPSPAAARGRRAD